MSLTSISVSKPSFFQRLRQLRQRRPNMVLFAIALAAYGVVSWLIIDAAGDPDIRFRINLGPLTMASFAVKLHVVSAVTAFGVGVFLMLGRKGHGLHRALGYTWVVAMAVVAISSFFIMDLNKGSLSLIHGLSAWTLVGLPMGIAAARRRDIRKHAKEMTQMFVGAMLIAGLFTLLPGRRLWSVFFAA